MRPQKVSVDIWTMLYSSCSYLALAFAAWIFLRLVQACFWFPAHLKNHNEDLQSKHCCLNNKNKKQQSISGEESNQDGVDVTSGDNQFNEDSLGDKKTD